MKSPDRGPTGGVRDAEERDAHAHVAVRGAARTVRSQCFRMPCPLEGGKGNN